MEEDVEIEMLLKSNEKLLMEAANEDRGNKEVEQHGKNKLSSHQVIKSSLNKENIYNLNEIAEPSTSSQANEFSEHISSNTDVICNFDNILKKQKTMVSPVKEEFSRKNTFVGSFEDQLNLRLLDLIARGDPLKFYLFKKNSNVSQSDEEEEDEEYIWSEDDIVDKDDCIGGMLEKPQNNSHLSRKMNVQKLQSIKHHTPNTKEQPILLLDSLRKMLLKRDKGFSEMEEKLQQISLGIVDRRKELQAALEEGRNKLKEPYTRCAFKRFGMPYFSDDRGFHPPPNKDHQQKLDNDEIIVESIPKVTHWTKPHKEMMKNAIKKTVIEEKSAKLIKEITQLEKILNDTVNLNQIESNKLLEQLLKNQNELKDLYTKSFKELVQSENENREYDWMKFSVSLFDGLHSAEECERFWNLYLKPSINKDAWSDVEDSKLLEIAAQLQYQDWKTIAQLLGTRRSPFQCFVHYKARLEGRSHILNGKWTEGEDKKLMTVINSSKVGNFIPWTKVSAYLGNRNHNQIYNRWSNALNPELVKGRFSKEEDLLIVSGIEVFGVSFKELASLMNNRTSSQIRERYERHLLPKTANVGTWSLEEDKKLLNLVQEYGALNWSKIADKIKTRTRTQVRQRYGFIQKMMKNKPGWTIAQVKRRNIDSKKTMESKINKDVANIKRDIDEIEKVFHFSKFEKESFLLEKLTELRDKIMHKKQLGKRGRKRREITVGSQQSDAILDLFLNCYTKTFTKTAKFVHNDIHSNLNQLFLLNKFLGIDSKFPKSEEEVWDSQGLSTAFKSFLVGVLNTNAVQCLSQSSITQPISSSPNTSKDENESVQRINHPIPEHDNTIIMNEWWHTPPVNVANLNFSEMFKRLVFDYSYGMHKDIWDSKVKRSLVSSTSHDYLHTEKTDHDCSRPEKKDLLPTLSHIFPPNQFFVLGERALLLSRPILKRQIKEMDSLKHILPDGFKNEIDEDGGDGDSYLKVNPNIINNVMNQLQKNLLTLFAWPHVLSTTQVGTVPVSNVQCSQKRRPTKKLKKNFTNNSRTNCGSTESGQTDTFVNSSDVSEEELILQEKPNPKRKLGKTDVIGSIKKQSEHLAKRKKSENGSFVNDKIKNCQAQESSSSLCLKININDTTLNANGNFNDNNLSNFEVTNTLDSSDFTYSEIQNSETRKTDNSFEKQLNDSESCSMEWQRSDADEYSLE